MIALKINLLPRSFFFEVKKAKLYDCGLGIESRWLTFENGGEMFVINNSVEFVRIFWRLFSIQLTHHCMKVNHTCIHIFGIVEKRLLAM
jgi:hypothetical protein